MIIDRELRLKGKAFLDSLKSNKMLKINNWRDWYQITTKDIIDYGGGSILKNFNNSVSNLIISSYPNEKWLITDFQTIPKKYYNHKMNQKMFMEYIRNNLGIKNWKDWYKYGSKEVKKLGGSILLSKYHGSYSKLIMSSFPDYPWSLTDFKQTSQSYWKNISNRKEFIKILESRLNIREWKDWYQITSNDIQQAGGNHLLSNCYNGSIPALLQSLLPNHQWNALEFNKTPRYYWRDPSNQINFIESIEKQLGIKNWTDWYHITQDEVIKLGGISLLTHYGYSLRKLIMSVYPQHPWRLFEFRTKFTWNSKLAQEFLNSITSQLRVNSFDAWRTLSSEQLKNFRGGRSLLKQTESLQGALNLAFPNKNWNFLSSSFKISQPQTNIVDLLSSYIKRDRMIINYRHPKLIHKSGIKAELDIWIPSINLAIEYHGEHHFHQLWERGENPSIRFNRDAEKRDLCKENNIDLVEVPYWWDKSKEQLIALIKRVQPSFLDQLNIFRHIYPIKFVFNPQEALLNNFQLNGNLATDYISTKIIDEWIISEKLDGIRCHWNGTNIYSRGKHIVDLTVPKIKVRDIIDGELWYQRGMRFGYGSNSNPNFMIFDIYN